MRMVTNRLPRYGMPILTTASASLFAVVLAPHSLRIAFALFAAAVIVSALEGGLKPGLLATALSTLALGVQYWLLPLSQPPESQAEVVPLLTLFVTVGLLSSYLGRQCWRAIHAVEWVQATLASFGDGLIFTDREGNVTFMNPVAHHLTGWNSQEAGRRMLGRVSRNGEEDSCHAVEHAVVRALKGEPQKPATESALLISRNGTAQSVDAQAAAIRDREGGLLGAMLVLRDVTATRQVERDLRHREQQFRSMAACAPVGILQMDPECRCVYANCSGQLTGGFSAKEALDEGWTRFLHPDDRARVLPDWTAAMQAGKEFVCEFRFPMPEQNPRWVHLCSSPMYSDVGKLIGHVGVFYDITEYKQTEEALCETHALLAAVAEVCADALFVKDQEGRYVLANTTGARMIGKTVKEIVGKDDNELFAADTASRIRDHDCQALASGQSQGREQADFAGDSRGRYRIRSMPFRDHQGEMAGLIRAYRDVSEEMQLKAELAKVQDALAVETDARAQAEQALEQCRAQHESCKEQAIELARLSTVVEEELRARQQAEERLREAEAALEKETQNCLELAAILDREQQKQEAPAPPTPDSALPLPAVEASLNGSTQA
jgi:PAS domain S-box-containing protein